MLENVGPSSGVGPATVESFSSHAPAARPVTSASRVIRTEALMLFRVLGRPPTDRHGLWRFSYTPAVARRHPVHIRAETPPDHMYGPRAILQVPLQSGEWRIAIRPNRKYETFSLPLRRSR